MLLYHLSCLPQLHTLTTHKNIPTHSLQIALDHRPPRNQSTKCSISTQISGPTNDRRSAKYQPTIWSYNFLQSMKSNHQNEKYEDKAKKLEEEVRCLLNRENKELLEILEVTDDIQRLGLGYRFQNEIKRALDKIFLWEEYDRVDVQNKLHVAALRFRLLRQHGYEISEDVFKTFMDQNGKFMETLDNDAKGILSLYEASYLAFVGEKLLDEALTFSRTHLNNQLKTEIDPAMSELISHALELTLHHRLPRLEARWYIESYSKRKHANKFLLELARLDFNRVQSIYQEDLKDMSRWWKEIDLTEKLKFARDRMTECFFWSVGMVPDPQHSNCRKGITKVTAFITVIDDIYDVYGTLDELELFTNAVERWDINTVNDLPDYMKLTFLALYNTVNEMAYDILKEHGENVIPYLTKSWGDMIKAFLQEAKWSRNKYTPTFEEYFENGWRSVSGVLILVHSYFLLSGNITTEALESLGNCQNLLRQPSIIFRLCNDLGTSKAELERGETASSIGSYIHEAGVTEELAREKLRNIIDRTWKKLNKSRMDEHFPFEETFAEAACNLARIAQCTYQYGDGHGAPDARAMKRVVSILVDPISFMELND